MLYIYKRLKGNAFRLLNAVSWRCPLAPPSVETFANFGKAARVLTFFLKKKDVRDKNWCKTLRSRKDKSYDCAYAVRGVRVSPFGFVLVKQAAIGWFQWVLGIVVNRRPMEYLWFTMSHPYRWSTFVCLWFVLPGIFLEQPGEAALRMRLLTAAARHHPSWLLLSLMSWGVLVVILQKQTPMRTDDEKRQIRE